MNVEQDVRTWLTGAGAAVSTCSTSFTFVGPMRKSKPNYPALAVAVREYGGLMPHGFQDGSTQTYRRTDVQIRVRAPVNGYTTGKALAEAIWQSMNRPNLASFTGGVVSGASVAYIRIQPTQSAPIFMGENDVEQPEWSINVRLESLSG